MNRANFHSLYDTPQCRRQMEGMYARLQSKLTWDTPPSEMMGAWANLRRELFIEPGLEGLTGPDATYHLIQDVPEYLLSAASLLAGHEDMPHRHRPRNAMAYMSKGMGYRYIRGVEGLTDALKAARVPYGELAKFQIAREVFTTEMVRKANAAWEVNDHGENPLAVLTVLKMFVEEMYALQGWLEVARQWSNAQMMGRELDGVVERMNQIVMDGTQLKRKPKIKKYGPGYWTWRGQ